VGLAVALSGQYLPCGQTLQKIWPMSGWKLPAPHGIALGVVVELHLVPTGQIVHADETGGL
jgi:hypothetical protein